MEKDFISSFELSAALIGLSPSLEKDIRSIEQGTIASLLMTHSAKSLKKISDLTNVDESTAKLLESRSVFLQYEYLEIDESTKNLIKNKVLIRPTSLKREDAEKAIQICKESSLVAWIRFILYKEKTFIVSHPLLIQQRKENILFTSMIQKPFILEMIQRFLSYSLESDYKLLQISSDLWNFIKKILTKSGHEIYDFLSTNKELDEECKQYLLEKNQHPVLIELSESFLYYYPTISYMMLIDEETEKIEIQKTELESFLEIAKEILVLLANYLDVDFHIKNPHPDWDSLFSLLSTHPSLQSEELWPNFKEFLEVIHSLLKICEGFGKIRTEIIIEQTIKNFLKNLNMKFSFVNLSIENFTIPKIAEKFINEEEKEKLFFTFISKLKKNPDLIVYESKTSQKNKNYYIIYKVNIPQCFIRNKNQRNFIHLVLKHLGYLNGIYDFLYSHTPITSSVPKILADEQRQLRQAIQDWEKQNQKKVKKNIFVVIWEWIKNLFIFTPKETTENTLKPYPSEPEIKKAKPLRRKSRYIPKEKLKTIPNRIEKAIEYIERQHHGFIWIEELAKTLNYNDIEQLYSILYYDKQQKYEEIKPLKSIKYLFIRKENLYNQEWIEKTIEFLENSSKLPHQTILLEFLYEIKQNLVD
ncbi:MAG: hypothetical protein ACK4UJ_03805 [Leptonema sp. (in: bacteria)]